MTDTSITAGQSSLTIPRLRISAIASAWFKNALYSMQYAQMIRAMNMLPDETLAEIGVKRSEIREHCEKLLDPPQN